jgi:hypothetical protein
LKAFQSQKSTNSRFLAKFAQKKQPVLVDDGTSRMAGNKLGTQQQPLALNLDSHWLERLQLQLLFVVRILLEAFHSQLIVTRIDGRHTGSAKLVRGKEPG